MYTDSLIYHIECHNVYDVIKRDISRFNMNDYPFDVYDILLTKCTKPDERQKTIAL